MRDDLTNIGQTLDSEPYRLFVKIREDSWMCFPFMYCQKLFCARARMTDQGKCSGKSGGKIFIDHESHESHE